MKKWPLIIVFAIALPAVSFKSFHHGWANYDQTKTLDYTGTVEKFTFENPHASASVKDKDKTWMVILAPTSRMDSRGVPSKKIVKGSQLRVVGYPHKTVKNEMRAERIYVGDVKYELR